MGLRAARWLASWSCLGSAQPVSVEAQCVPAGGARPGALMLPLPVSAPGSGPAPWGTGACRALAGTSFSASHAVRPTLCFPAFSSPEFPQSKASSADRGWGETKASG